MAQLIKLQDYVSRYEQDIFRYPGQFIRLKKENYDGIKQQWLEQKEQDQISPVVEEEEVDKKKGFFKKWFKREEDDDQFETVDQSISQLPDEEDDLKRDFLDRIFQFQLKWASSTLQEVSFLDRLYESDDQLKYFLMRFPDTFLLFYHPIFKLNKALLEGDIIMVTPTSIQCIYWLDTDNESAVYEAVDQRKWKKRINGEEKSVVNPNIALKRMEGAIRSILNHHEIDYTIEKIVLSQNGVIQYNHSPYQTHYIDESTYDTWFQNQRTTSTPLKHQQLKVSGALLEHTQTTSINRPEWEDVEEDF
ncbi:NERD domain-containing protein [Alkalibacillus sp. S2W]|uniref:NERD domain-containing protein n=1 Tax=Alkalibacillus sp. S2W TaxID=3386553 RepID=UPI00398D59CD